MQMLTGNFEITESNHIILQARKPRVSSQVWGRELTITCPESCAAWSRLESPLQLRVRKALPVTQTDIASVGADSHNLPR